MNSNKRGSSSGVNEGKYPPLPASPLPATLEDAFREDDELKIANAMDIIQTQGNKYDPPITLEDMPFTMNDPLGKKWAAKHGMNPPPHTTAPPPSLDGAPYPKRRIGQSIVNATVMAKKSIMNKQRNAAAAGGGGINFSGLWKGGSKRRRHKKQATRRRRHHKK